MISNAPATDLPLPQNSSSLSIVPDVADVYALFAALSSLARHRFDGELGGKLLLYGPLDANGAAVALAGNIAGAATLGVDSDGDRLRQGIRHGFCDFLVNNLDEALRILKNEVRKRQPVSVCLEGDLAATLKEAVERGLQPDILADSLPAAEVAILIQRGAIMLETGSVADASFAGISWTAQVAPALWLPKVDALAAEVLPEGDERRRWLRFAPRYLGRSMAARRYLRMANVEANQLSTLVTEAVASGAIGSAITITPWS